MGTDVHGGWLGWSAPNALRAEARKLTEVAALSLAVYFIWHSIEEFLPTSVELVIMSLATELRA